MTQAHTGQGFGKRSFPSLWLTVLSTMDKVHCKSGREGLSDLEDCLASHTGAPLAAAEMGFPSQKHTILSEIAVHAITTLHPLGDR